MSVNSKMTTIADKTRELVGSTEKMGLDAIASNLETTVGEVDAQNVLIQQIKTGLAEAEENIGRTNNEIASQTEIIKHIKAGLSEAEENIGRTNNEISDQAVLLQRIEAALEGKTTGVQLPTLTNPGTAGDLARGKELIDADGNVVVGTIPVENEEFAGWCTEFYDSDGIITSMFTAQSDCLVRKGTPVYIDASATKYGDLTPEDAPKGKTFTSAAGFCVTGTAEPSSVGIKTTKLTSNSTSISFSGLTAQPKMFFICPTGNISLSSTRYVTGVMYDGSKTHGTYGYRSSSSGTSYYSASYFTWTYSNGTLTVRSSSSTNGGNFSSSVTYQLAYIT